MVQTSDVVIAGALVAGIGVGGWLIGKQLEGLGNPLSDLGDAFKGFGESARETSGDIAALATGKVDDPAKDAANADKAMRSSQEKAGLFDLIGRTDAEGKSLFVAKAKELGLVGKPSLNEVGVPVARQPMSFPETSFIDDLGFGLRGTGERTNRPLELLRPPTDPVFNRPITTAQRIGFETRRDVQALGRFASAIPEAVAPADRAGGVLPGTRNLVDMILGR